MSDSFFELGAGMPDYEAGLGSELREAREDASIDLLNDETFGADLEDDWDLEEHQKVVESELEESINQLVVEDEESTDIPKGRPIPQKHAVDLDALYGPSSPPGLLRTQQLVGGEDNIWGSPVKDSPMQQVQRQDDELKQLLKQMQVPPKRNVPQQECFMSKPVSMSLPNAKTLDEIEQEMMGGGGGNGGGGAPGMGPTLMTVEQLERELHARAVPPEHHHVRRVPSPVNPGLPLPIGTPPQGHFLQQAAAQQQVAGQQRPAMMINAREINSALLRNGTPPSGIAMVRTRGPSPPTLPGVPRLLQRTMSPGPGQQPSPLSTSAPQSHPDFRQQQLDRRGSGENIVGSPTQRPPLVLDNRVGSPAHRQQFTVDNRTRRGSNENMQHRPQFTVDNRRGLNDNMGPQQQQQRPPFTVDNRRGSGDNMVPPGMHRPPPPFMVDGRVGSPAQHPPPPFMPDGRRGSGDNVIIGSPLQRHSFLANTPVLQRIPPQLPHTVPSMHRPQRGGIYPGRTRHGSGEYPGGWQQQGPQGRGGGPRPPRPDGRDDMRRGPGQHYRHYRHAPWEQNQNQQQYTTNGSADEYANLMTKKEKDWIIKIQLLQLQTDNPYLDDFYYTTWNLMKIAQERKRDMKKGSEPKLVLPHLSRVDTKAYKPAQFEGALGRLTSSSVHNPRRIIDLRGRKFSENEEPKVGETRQFKERLWGIEQGYDMLLEIDDLEKKVLALPEDAKQPLLVERSQTIHKLVHSIYDSSNKENFQQLIMVKKGAKLVARVLPLISLEEAISLVCALLQYLPILSNKDWQDEPLPCLFESMSQVVCCCDLAALVKCVVALRRAPSAEQEDDDNIIATGLQNKFGCSLLWCLLNQGDHIYSTQSPVDMEVQHQNAWKQFVIEVADALDHVCKTSLATPAHLPTASLDKHLASFLDKKMFAAIEDKITGLIRKSPEEMT